MEGVLLIVSTGFAPGSVYGLTLFVHGYFAVCASTFGSSTIFLVLYEAFLKLLCLGA